MLGDAQTALESGILPEQLLAYVGRAERKGKVISCERGFWRRIMTAYMLMRIHLPHITKIAYLAVYGVWVLLHAGRVKK